MLSLARGVAALCLLALPLQVSADDTASLDDKVQYILNVTNMEKSFDVGYEYFRPTILEQIKRSSDKVTPEIADHIASIMEEELKSAKPAIRLFVIDYYKKNLTDEEITALYDFYRSPTGARLAGKLNTLTGNLMFELRDFLGRQVRMKMIARLNSDPVFRDTFKP